MDVTVDLGPIVEGLAVGDSVALSGCCVTVTRISGAEADFHMVRETLARTWFGCLAPGTEVNLERALLATARLGGHFVQGHVDGVGEVLGLESHGDGSDLRLRVPTDLARYCVEKGSIGLDGVSLTIAAMDGEAVTTALIPHTLEATTLGQLATGDPVHLEVDVLAKYVERLLEGHELARPQAGGSPAEGHSPA
jgi:riboflavin synthase